MKKRIVSYLLVLAMVIGLMPVIALANEPEYLYVSISADDKYIFTDSGELMAYYPIPIAALYEIDLSDYSNSLGYYPLGDYAYDADEDGNNEITAMHAVIYIHEQVFGLSMDDVMVTGEPGSAFFSSGVFGFSDCNLTYFYNGSYPIEYTGWGATVDHIIVSAGDFLDVSWFTDWNFLSDSACGYHYFTDDAGSITHSYTAEAGKPFQMVLQRNQPDLFNGGESGLFPEADFEVFYGTTYDEPTGSFYSDSDGCVEITFPSAGTWYVWCDGGEGVDMAAGSVVSSPAYAVVTVTSASDPNQDAADAVIAKINGIDTVDLNSEAKITEARAAYDTLTDAQKALVTNYETLTDAETKLAQLKADKEAIDDVIGKINAIGTVTLNKEADITAARAAYDALTPARKEQVTNYATLTAAETKLAELKADKAAADAVIQMIGNIGTVTLESESAINDAWDAYNALSVAQKNLVSNYAVLTEAQATLTQLKNDAAQAAADQEAADAVIGKINAIGTVTLDDEETVTAAREAFEALTNAQKALVTNYEVLTAAEEELAVLKADQEAADAVVQKIHDIGTVALDKEDDIKAARAAYEDLTVEQKALVSNYTVLTAAEEKLQKLKDEAAQAVIDHTAADAVEETIATIGKVDVFSGSKVSAARDAYDALTDVQKTLVENGNKLTDAEETLKQLYKEAAKADHKAIFDVTAKYISGLGTPNVGSTGGEWMVIGLVRAGNPCPEGYYENVVKYVKANINDKEQLDRSKGTDNSRVILALTAAGYDVTDVAGHNLLMGLTDMTYVKKQGINGPIWALIAFDSHGYEIPVNPNAAEQVTREKLVDVILAAQKSDGGWGLGVNTDTDMTGMAIQSLAPYYETNAKVKAAVDAGLECLSGRQSAAGGFGSIDGVSVESCAQVVVALTALGIDPETDSRFMKNGISVLDALCLFAVEGGGFEHVPNGGINGMATEQGQYALAAYFRFKNGQTALYDMSDVLLRGNNEGAGKVDNTTDSNDNAHSGTLETPSEELFDKLLTEEEQKLVESGVDIRVDLVVEDISESVSEADKLLVKEKLGENTIGMYLDITLTKQLGESSPIKITETAGAVTVMITVPEELRNSNSKLVRTYQVIRVHEGKVDVLDASYDEKTGKLSFETDCFSTYTLVYTDAPASNNPNTGDHANVALHTAVMLVSVICLAALLLDSKKINK